MPPDLVKKRRLDFGLVGLQCRAAPNELDPLIDMFAAMLCMKDKADRAWRRGVKSQNMGGTNVPPIVRPKPATQ